MKLSLEEVKKIARLSRIDLGSAEAERFRSELSQIIDFNATKLVQIKRRVKVQQLLSPELGQEDIPRPSLSSDDALSNAPRQDKGFFVVPKVLE